MKIRRFVIARRKDLGTLPRLAVLALGAGSLLSVLAGPGREVPNTSPQATGTTHTYYIAADEVDWNYAPAEIDQMTGKPYDERARIFLVNDPQHRQNL